MKSLLLILCAFSALCLKAHDVKRLPDFFHKDPDGKITLRGYYSVDDAGCVIRYELFDGDRNLVTIGIPTYTSDGKLLESREYDSQGSLKEVIVVIGEYTVGLTPEGEKLGNYNNPPVSIEGYKKHVMLRAIHEHNQKKQNKSEMATPRKPSD